MASATLSKSLKVRVLLLAAPLHRPSHPPVSARPPHSSSSPSCSPRSRTPCTLPRDLPSLGARRRSHSRRALTSRLSFVRRRLSFVRHGSASSGGALHAPCMRQMHGRGYVAVGSAPAQIWRASSAAVPHMAADGALPPQSAIFGMWGSTELPYLGIPPGALA